MHHAYKFIFQSKGTDGCIPEEIVGTNEKGKLFAVYLFQTIRTEHNTVYTYSPD